MRALGSTLVLATFVAFAALWLSHPSDAAVWDAREAQVKLFSNGEVVGEWRAIGPGRVDGSTFVFPVRKGSRDVEVRISGTFSFEPI